jgi:hypothetical protein
VPNGLYERDALAWAERQADLLARIAAGEQPNEMVDWPHVIEEVRDVGLSELRQCRSLLRQAMVHLLKLHVRPGDPAAQHWLVEAAAFLDDARDRYAPSMRQRIDLAQLYDDALARVALLADSDPVHAAASLPAACPFTLDDLVASRPDIRRLVRSLAG